MGTAPLTCDTFILSQHDYSYNGAGQRKSAQDRIGIYAPPAMNEAYAYDPLGNRTTKTDGSNPLYYVVDAANQLKEIRQTNAGGALLAAMIYDANGNLTQKCEGGGVTTNGTTSCTGASVTTLTYDALNQLTGVNKDGQLSQYAYDDAGRRIKKTVNGSTVNYLYNGPDILAEYQNWSKANISYTHGPNTDDPLIRVTAANDNSYFHQDGLGSVVATTGQTGNLTAAQLYDAWGKPQQGASLGNLGQYGYTGREPDETGMMYYRARYYDPTIGRFTQRDPIGLRGGINRYAYVDGNPMSYTDPFGLSPHIQLAANSNYFSDTMTDVGNALSSGYQKLSSSVSQDWDTSVAGTIGKDFGALAAIAQGTVTGDQALVDVAVQGLAENKQGNIDALLMLGTMGRGGAKVGSKSGEFSITDWTGYPAGIPQPTGPFRLLEGAEYDAARNAANQANRALHKADPSLAGQQIHEVQPVKFNGSPTDPANKIPLTQSEHAPVTNWWNQLQRNIFGR